MPYWAITPHGVGRPPGARAIRQDWLLTDQEVAAGGFIVECDTVSGMVVGADGRSLRSGAPEELNPPPPPTLEDRVRALELESEARRVR